MILTFASFLSSAAYAQSGETAVDANAPASASPLQIGIPHSGRTKGNLLDAGLDFMFSLFFKRFKDFEISYDFFEVNALQDLQFTNFKVVSKHPDARGTFLVKKAVVDFADFMETLKAQKATLSKIGLESVSGDFSVVETVKKTRTDADGKNVTVKEKKARRVVFSAASVQLKNVLLASWSNSSDEVVAGVAAGRDAKVILSDPDETYAASSVEVREISVPNGKLDKTVFSSATVDGKEYRDAASFLQAVKKKNGARR